MLGVVWSWVMCCCVVSWWVDEKIMGGVEEVMFVFWFVLLFNVIFLLL